MVGRERGPRSSPLLPPVASGGRRWRDHRQVINAILWKLQTGAPWPDLPERYGPWKTAGTNGRSCGPGWDLAEDRDLLDRRRLSTGASIIDTADPAAR
jgi:transposase